DAFFKKHKGSIEDFAEYFGIDIIDYPYTDHAFVVKNSAVLERPVGYKRSLMSFGKLLEKAGAVKTPAEFDQLVRDIEINRVNENEIKMLFAKTPFFGKAVEELAAKLGTGHFLTELKGSPLSRLFASQGHYLLGELGSHVRTIEALDELVEASSILCTWLGNNRNIFGARNT